MPFCGIYVQSGSVEVGTVIGNAIGDTTGTAAISLLSGAQSLSYGIYLGAGQVATVAQNRIGAIRLGSNWNSHSFTAIDKAASAGQVTIRNNTIGSLGTAGSITAVSANDGQQQNLMGICSQGTGTVLITGNTIANLANQSNEQNSYVYGISSEGSGHTTISSNFVWNLSLTSTAYTNVLSGIHTSKGSNQVINNIVCLGSNLSNALFQLYGLYSANSDSDQIYHNTVYLSGSITGSTQIGTSAFYRQSSGVVIVKNNIFFNARSGGSGAGRHAAVAVNNATGVVSNYNLLYAPNTNGVTGIVISGIWNQTPYSTLSSWQSATGLELNSTNNNPQLVNPGSSLPEQYQTSVDWNGTDLTVIVSTDFGGNVRTVPPTPGAWEFGAAFKVTIYRGTEFLAWYNTLKAAFDDINNGNKTGDLTIRINRSTTETATAALNASGSGSASYTHLLIYPTTASVSVSGNINGP
jgi:hypothetical protein